MKHWRKHIKLSQLELARLVSASQTTISDIELGLHVPSVVLALKISRVLGRTVEEVFFLEETVGDKQ
ncbi:MAG TPA: helix-turn-helix domain-containing protein [Clostridia bacterium]|nr:helix-turn-helix domain-containing protein [Clostridia bacterium]